MSAFTDENDSETIQSASNICMNAKWIHYDWRHYNEQQMHP